MKEFKPSQNFTARVMSDVRVHEALKNQDASWTQMFFSTRFARYALSIGGGLLGIINLVRICLTVFSPVACR